MMVHLWQLPLLLRETFLPRITFLWKMDYFTLEKGISQITLWTFPDFAIKKFGQ